MAVAAQNERWTNSSVRILAGDSDPVAVITELARSLLLAAVDAGLTGPPVDPFRLAKLMGLHILAHADVGDARIRPGTVEIDSREDAPLSKYVGTASPLILEYNPVRPRGRLRHSMAHEIAHALFPDVADTVRQRTGTGAVPRLDSSDAWQLELLCNIAAAEFLMPKEAVKGVLDTDFNIDFLMDIRARLEVSTEALVRGLVSGASRPIAAIAASRIRDEASSPLRVDYVHPSRVWTPRARHGRHLKPSSVFAEPTAVGQITRGTVTVDGETLRAQTVGIPPYPGAALPRVLGLVEPLDVRRAASPGIATGKGIW